MFVISINFVICMFVIASFDCICYGSCLKIRERIGCCRRRDPVLRELFETRKESSSVEEELEGKLQLTC